MKKLISIVLLLAMTLSLLAGCTLLPAKEPSATLEDAKKFLVSYFQGTSATTDVDWKVPGSITVNETVFNVVWTSDNENIQIVPQEDGKVLIDLPELSAEEVAYTLTATITLDGQDGEITYSRTCKMSASASTGKTPEQIVDEIYQLKDSKISSDSTDKIDDNGNRVDASGNIVATKAELLMEGVTLTGKVIAISAAYEPNYKNITVVMQIGNLTDKPITAYRLKATADNAELAAALAALLPGDTITVNGPVKNYGGTYEFDTGCLMTAYTKGETVTAPTDPAQIVADAQALAQGHGLPYKATLTGVVKSINTAFSTKNNNITVTIDVNGTSIQCYRLVGSEGANIAVGDTITVTGPIMNYKGNIQFVENTALVSRVAGNGSYVPETPDLPANAVLQIGGVYITGTESLYAEKNKIQLLTSANIADALAFTLIKNNDGTVSFKTSDNYFLYCNATDVKFVTEEGDYTKFIIETAANGYFIKCAVADYNGSAQYLEYYKDVLTSFGMGSDLTAFTFTFAETTGANGTVVKYTAPGTQPENPDTEAPTIADGTYVLWTPADNKAMDALAADKNYGYAPGSNVTLANGVLTGYTNNNIFTVVNNGDGTFKLYDIHGRLVHMSGTHNSFQVTADATSVTEGANWTLTAADNGCFIITNVDKQKTFHYSSSFGTFESVNTASTPMMLTAAQKVTEPEPENPGTQPENPSVSNNHFDFSAVNSSYGSYTSASGWVAVNSAIQGGGSDQAKDNKYFSAIGADDSTKAVCLNGKTSAVGKLTSPTLSGGISKLTFNYGIMFSDNTVSVTIKITDSNGVSQTTTLSDTTLTKYAVETFTWTLDTAISGDFTIEITNNCPSASASSNKDRISIWNIDWEA